MEKNAGTTGTALAFDLETVCGACPVICEGTVNGIPVSIYYRDGVLEVSLYEASPDCFRREPAEFFRDRIGDSLDGFITYGEMIENASDLLSASRLLGMGRTGEGEPVLPVESCALARGMLDAGVPVDGRDRKMRTPLIRAARQCREDVAELLLEYGADPDAADEDGMTALHHAAAFCNCPGMIKTLVRAGAGVNRTDSRGKTALVRHMANWDSPDDFGTAAALLEAGADPDIPDEEGKTALFYAAEHPFCVEMTETLLSAGADPLAVDRKGRTVLMGLLGGFFSDESYFGYFLEKYTAAGGDLDAADREGRTALQYAAARITCLGKQFGQLIGAGADPDAAGRGADLLEAMKKDGESSLAVKKATEEGRLHLLFCEDEP